MATLDIVYLSPASLKARATNARTHSKKQIGQIADSITTFGFTNPILIDRDKTVVAGHGRLEAAKLLGLKSVPTIRLDDLSPDQIRAYVIADNKLAENAGWDTDLLALELQGLMELDLGFDVTVTGFEMAEIDLLIDGPNTEDDADPNDSIPQIQDGPAITRPGDVWQIGPHRLICGDATQTETYTHLLKDAVAQMVFTDPPYNVPIDGHVSGLGDVKHREFAMASGEMSAAEFTRFLTTVFNNLASVSADGAIHFICMDWRHMSEVLRPHWISIDRRSRPTRSVGAVNRTAPASKRASPAT